MGIYIYSMRAKTANIWVGTERFAANLYSYAYKYYSDWGEDRSYSMLVANTKRRADDAFHSQRSGYVIMGDPARGLVNDAVYKDVTSPLWYDTDHFPGTLIGWLRKDGNRLVVADRTEWSTGSSTYLRESDKTWIPFTSRMIMVDGKPVYEKRDLAPDRDTASACELNSGDCG